MTVNISAPWHKESFDSFLRDRLPALLAERVPLAGYTVESSGQYSCTIRLAVDGKHDVIRLEYPSIPQPDPEGVFLLDGRPWLVLPLATSESLDTAEIRCVGEQLYAFVEARLGQAPPDLEWDEALVRSWLPLDAWIAEFLRHGTPWRDEPVSGVVFEDVNRMQSTAQPLDDVNWLSRHVHRRRLIVPRHTRVFHASEVGRLCPFETPEGPNVGRVLTVANGAAIRDGKLPMAEDEPEARLGLTALMVPFLEHNDANRQLMGVNMMRQWLEPPDPEPAWVQTGHEPDLPEFWCGRNVLTAFVSWGPDAFEDGILISESCAKRFGFPEPLEAGDKLSNRHGTKGVVSRIVPDDAMPHLDDGTPVELVFNFIGCHPRLNFGQIREAIMGRIARAEGAQPAIVPPFHAPRADELRARLKKARLPESGMEVLRMGRQGRELERPSTVGWVYWGKTRHLARRKLHANLPGAGAQEFGDLEYFALRDAGAFENIAERFNTCSADRKDAAQLLTRLAAGATSQAEAPTPLFARLAARLRAAGIAAEIRNGQLAFGFAAPEAGPLRLARPIAHPWAADHTLDEIGVDASWPEHAAMVRAHERLERLLTTHAPEALVQQGARQLENAARQYFDALLNPDVLAFRAATTFCARGVIAPSGDLRLDQVGIPDEIAWALFGPLVARETGAEEEVRTRSPRAAKVLDALMADAWVVLQVWPAIMPTSFLAFHPVREAGCVIRIPVLVTALMNADFDGDQATVFLPITEGGQREAGERLSVTGQLRRDPRLVKWLGEQDIVFGLALLSLTPDGHREVEALAGEPIAAPEGYITRHSLHEAIAGLSEREGIERALAALDRLKRRGFEISKASGASISPFFGETIPDGPNPAPDDVPAWDACAEIVEEHVASRLDFTSLDIGPQLLAVKTAARGVIRQVARLIGPRVVKDAHGELVAVRHGFVQGYTSKEAFDCAVGAREGLAQIAIETTRAAYGIPAPTPPGGFHVLARAMRSKHPGIVFAHAAATQEVDPLTDTDSRLFVGLPVVGR